MTDAENLADLETLPTDRTRLVVGTAAAEMVPSIVDEELAGVRARFTERHAAERQRMRNELAREASRAWWRAWTQRQAGKVTSIRRRA